jgi:Fe(II)/alpha-ketoglutarate-dependent arginine beta-hydroxylase
MEKYMNRLSMFAEEISALKNLLAEVTTQYTSVERPDFLKEAALIAHQMPKRISRFFNDFKQLELPSGACVITGYPVDDQKIGPTPAHWKVRPEISPALEAEMLFVLLGSLLGDPIGWATQQRGYILHEVIPIREDENAQISTGSLQTIWWHNEDAFHPYRGDYVGLMCLRNPKRVPTTFASIDMIELDPKIKEILFEPHFVIRPDASHAPKNNGNGHVHDHGIDDFGEIAYAQIQRLQVDSPKLSVLYGDPDSPYLRLDPYFMDPLGDDEAQFALNSLIHAIDACLAEVVLQPGDCLFIDNYRSVHGRKPFKASYDGTDRWLKRINITRDLRKSRAARHSCTSRIIC